MIDIATLKSAAPLAEVIGEHVRLAKRGKTLWGRCPFHDEKTPSFAVHPEYFHCHGCGASGDVIDFTSRIEGVGKGRAISILAERYGVTAGPRQTRAESTYMRGLRAQGEFWWSALRSRAVDRMYFAFDCFILDQSRENEIRLDLASGYIRLLDSISPPIRGRAFLSLRGAADNRAWEESRAEIRMLGLIFGVTA